MQRSLRASWPSTSLAVRLASCFAACLTISTLSGCSQIVDFDRSKIADDKDGAPEPEDSGTGGRDSGAKDAGSKDSGMSMPEAGTDAGGDACDPATNEGCMPTELCCADSDGVLGCVPTSVAQCEGCGMACDANVANDCTDRTCGCGWMSKLSCSGATPKCDAAQDKCVECVTTADCSANATNKFCFARGATPNAKDNTCVVCDPATNSGCDGTTPICNASATCEACTASPNNCGGTLVCLGTGACQCAASSDCTTPTTPICEGTSKTCIACTTDAQCNGKTPGRVCVTGGAGSTVGSCGVCDPTDDGGCSGVNNQCKPGAVPACVDCLADSDCAGATPLCDLGTNACVACDAGAIPAGERDTRCDAKTGANACVTTGTKKGECAACDPAADQTGCTNTQLCCAGGGGALGCEATAPGTQCTACDTACNATNANACLAGRTCACGTAAPCGGATPVCSGTACVQCVANGDCAGVAGKPLCDTTTNSATINSCVACRTSADCTTADAPICNGSKVCAACTTDAECLAAPGGNNICATGGTNAGRCGSCDPTDSAECTTAAAPICNATSLACAACASNAECAGRAGAADYCVTGGTGSTVGSCAACNPANDSGCVAPNDQCLAGATPACADCDGAAGCADTPTTPSCEIATNTCVCTGNADCSGNLACVAKACKACTADAECTGHPTGSQCANTGASTECRACDPKDVVDLGDDEGCPVGKPCLTATFTCTP